MILGILFEQIWISLPQWISIPNINAFRPVIHEKKTWSNPNPHHPSMFPTKFCWNWPRSSWEEYFKAFLYILPCKSLSPWGGAIHDPRDFIWRKLNLLAPRMLHAKYHCIPASDSWEEGFWSFIKIFLILLLIGPQ